MRGLGLAFGGRWYARRVGVEVGQRVRILTTHFGSEPFLIEIGDDSTITSGVRFITHDGATCLVKDERGRRFEFGRIAVGSRTFIGVNSVVMPGVAIGSDVIVGAGSVVTRSIPDGAVAAGVPARVIGAVADYRKRVASICVAEADHPSKQATGYRRWVELCLEQQAALRRSRESD